MTRLRSALLMACLAVPAVAPPAAVRAQALPLKREMPAVQWAGCPAAPLPREVGPAQRLEAERLAAAATQASILGNGREAADMLARAAEMDPRSASILHRLARAEDDLGRVENAVTAYCRYIAVAPDAADADDVSARLEALASPGRFAVPPAAFEAFEEGLALYDSASLLEADIAFGRAVAAAPAWADPVYNRGMVRLALDFRDDAAEDLRRYLEMNPGSHDFNQVLDVLGSLRGVVATPYSPGTALAAGLLLPGLGHFTTGRAGTGMLFFGGAAAAVAAGIAVKRVSVDCLAPVVNGVCPPDEILRENTDRPYLVPALGAALALGIWGAIDAYRGARRGNERATELLRVGSRAGGATLVARLQLQRHGNRTRMELLRLRF